MIGSVELVGVLHDNVGWRNPVTDWVSNINLNNVGFAIVGLFVATWVVAVGYWRWAKVEHRGRRPLLRHRQATRPNG